MGTWGFVELAVRERTRVYFRFHFTKISSSNYQNPTMATNGTEPKLDADSVEESSQDESEVNLSVDEASDSENYQPPVEDPVSDECSSGDDEGDFEVEEKKDGTSKLKYKDVEEYRNKVRRNSSEEEQEAADSAEKPSEEVTMNTDLSAYESAEDNDFNPVYCADSMSDIDIEGSDNETQESEPEVEEQGDRCRYIHKKTGETLKCIRMIDEMKIPCNEESAPITAPGAAVSAELGDMECS